MEISQSPGLPEPEAVHAMVVYDPKTGVIIHRHIAVRYPGGRKQETSELEARALELIAARGIETKALRVLVVDPAAFANEVEQRVDVNRQILVHSRNQPLTHAKLLRRSKKSSKSPKK
jgi:hypothetical protein